MCLAVLHVIQSSKKVDKTHSLFLSCLAGLNRRTFPLIRKKIILLSWCQDEKCNSFVINCVSCRVFTSQQRTRKTCAGPLVPHCGHRRTLLAVAAALYQAYSSDFLHAGVSQQNTSKLKSFFWGGGFLRCSHRLKSFCDSGAIIK